MTDEPDLAARVAEAMPRLKRELGTLVAIPGLSEWDFPEHTRAPLLETHEALIPLFRDAGVERISSLELPNTAPILTGEIPAPDGAPHPPSLCVTRVTRVTNGQPWRTT